MVVARIARHDMDIQFTPTHLCTGIGPEIRTMEDMPSSGFRIAPGADDDERMPSPREYSAIALDRPDLGLHPCPVAKELPAPPCPRRLRQVQNSHPQQEWAAGHSQYDAQAPG